ncbi:hypothetical protein ABU614_07725 [Lysobacter firmicutimachus]|uniref:Uncharacterized protein n=1 Tax=Lysobacter firmicutimachus TaxID=1792846 RepID=A0AAU8MW14_9GAMM|nr:hypothetical protein [Lysobacter antibioticus]
MNVSKAKLGGLLFGFVLSLAALPSLAASSGGATPVPSDPARFGEWKASVRWLQPHRVDGPGGSMVYSWTYAHITALSQSECETQLYGYASQLNVQVVNYCAFYPY